MVLRNERSLQNCNELPGNNKRSKGETYSININNTSQSNILSSWGFIYNRDMKNLEGIHEGIIMPEDRKLKSGMRKGTVKK